MDDNPINKPLSLCGKQSKYLGKTHFALKDFNTPARAGPRKSPFFPPFFFPPRFLFFHNETIPAAGEEPRGWCQALSKQPRSLELLPAGSWNSVPLADNASVIHALADRGVSSFVTRFPRVFTGVLGKAAWKRGTGGQGRLVGVGNAPGWLFWGWLFAILGVSDSAGMQE